MIWFNYNTVQFYGSQTYRYKGTALNLVGSRVQNKSGGMYYRHFKLLFSF